MKVLQEIRNLLSSGSFTSEQTEKINRKLAYLENHSGRTDYGKFRAKGYFIGSGVIEAGCKCAVSPQTSNRACSGAKPTQNTFSSQRLWFSGLTIPARGQDAPRLLPNIARKLAAGAPQN